MELEELITENSEDSTKLYPYISKIKNGFVNLNLQTLLAKIYELKMQTLSTIETNTDL